MLECMDLTGRVTAILLITLIVVVLAVVAEPVI